MCTHAACLNSLVSAWYSLNAVSHLLDSLSKLLLSFHKDILLLLDARLSPDQWTHVRYLCHAATPRQVSILLPVMGGDLWKRSVQPPNLRSLCVFKEVGKNECISRSVEAQDILQLPFLLVINSSVSSSKDRSSDSVCCARNISLYFSSDW